jgi:CO/xanthine dehydrogenase Mo-binding subunit
VHGIGNALFEELSYNADGQPLTSTFMDYLLPTAADVSSFKVVHRPHPTPLNPLGVKGAGEGATASAPGAIVNAIADALKPLDVDITEIPLGPERLVELIHQALERTGRDPDFPSGSVSE